MSRLTRAWVEAQIERELERGNHPEAVRDLAALVTVHEYLKGKQGTYGQMGMRDHNEIIIGEYTDQRGDDMRQYGRRYNPDHAEHMPAHVEPVPAHHSGHLSHEEAEAWVHGMKSEDGKTGGRWSMHEIKQYAGNFGVHGEDEVIEFFAVMNALYADYCKVAKKYGVDKIDFWADLAKAFMHDKDAVEGKVKKYYECIAKHDDD